MLRVTRRHVDDRCVDRHGLACRELLTAAANSAYVEGDLVAAAPLVARAAEDVTSQSEQQSVVVQAPPRRALQVVYRFAEGCERVGLHLEAQHARARPFDRWCVGRVSRCSARDERFELAEGLAASGVEPAGLGVGEGYPRELARSAPAEGPPPRARLRGGVASRATPRRAASPESCGVCSRRATRRTARSWRSPGEGAPPSARRAIANGPLRRRAPLARARAETAPRAPGPNRRFHWPRAPKRRQVSSCRRR